MSLPWSKPYRNPPVSKSPEVRVTSAIFTCTLGCIPFVIIPFQKLSKEALHGVIEEFVTRNGTDYGFIETDLEQKIDRVLRQLRTGDVFIVYDQAAETTTILSKEEVVKAECD